MATNPPYCVGRSCEPDVTRAVALLAGRWSVPVLEALHFAGAPVRFRELQRRLGGISQKELVRHLTLFVHHGVASRREQAVARTGVAYALTDRGEALLRQMDALGQWARQGHGGSASDAPRTPLPASWLSPLVHDRDD